MEENRIKGVANFAVNFEPGGQSPLDARLLVPTKEALINSSTYSEKNYYKGMMVVVGDTQEVYILTDINKITQSDYSGWKKVGTDDEVLQDLAESVDNLSSEVSKAQESITTIQENVTTIQENVTTAQNDIDKIENDIDKIENNVLGLYKLKAPIVISDYDTGKDVSVTNNDPEEITGIVGTPQELYNAIMNHTIISGVVQAGDSTFDIATCGGIYSDKTMTISCTIGNNQILVISASVLSDDDTTWDELNYDVYSLLSKTSIVDNLNTTNTNLALSANQGKILNEEKISMYICPGEYTIGTSIDGQSTVKNIFGTPFALGTAIKNNKIIVCHFKDSAGLSYTSSCFGTFRKQESSIRPGFVLSFTLNNSIIQFFLSTWSTNDYPDNLESDYSVYSYATIYTLLDTLDIINNLTSTSTDEPLSANQGRILNGYINDIKSKYLATADLGEGWKSALKSASNSVSHTLKFINVDSGNISSELMSKSFLQTVPSIINIVAEEPIVLTRGWNNSATITYAPPYPLYNKGNDEAVSNRTYRLLSMRQNNGSGVGNANQKGLVFDIYSTSEFTGISKSTVYISWNIINYDRVKFEYEGNFKFINNLKLYYVGTRNDLYLENISGSDIITINNVILLTDENYSLSIGSTAKVDTRMKFTEAEIPSSYTEVWTPTKRDSV